MSAIYNPEAMAFGMPLRSGSPEEARLRREKEQMRRFVQQEFATVDPNDHAANAIALAKERYGDSADEYVYGGAESAEPQEMQMVEAWRLTPSGEWEMAQGVVHRVHGGMVTVQFLDNQHRIRLPKESVKPYLNIDPIYPKVRLAPGERVPTASEIAEREARANAYRSANGIAQDAPLPGQFDNPDALRAGQYKNEAGITCFAADYWGIPATTLDALRNRSIPPGQVTGAYGPHFYTSLYRNNFYAQRQKTVFGQDGRQRHGDLQHITGHIYRQLDGQEFEKDLATGAWRPINREELSEEPDIGNSGMWIFG